MIGFLLLVISYNHPFSANAAHLLRTTPIMPDVKGRVAEVPSSLSYRDVEDMCAEREH